MKPTGWAIAVVGLMSTTALACSDRAHKTATASAAATTVAAAEAAPAEQQAVSFATDIVPVLKHNCQVCHLTGQEAGNLALHAKGAYDSLVSKPSISAPALLRVAPGDPDKSYLLAKIRGTHLDVGGSGRRMPFDGAFLDETTVQKISDWIKAGAPRN